MYPRQKTPLKKKLIIVFGATLVVVLLGIGASSLMKKSTTQKINDNLKEFIDPLFTMKYPKDFIAQSDNDIVISFAPAAEANSPESIRVTSKPFTKGGLTIDNVGTSFQKTSDKKAADSYPVQKTKLDNVDAAILTKKGTDNVDTKIIYVFYPKTIWIITITYTPGGNLDKSTDAILASFKAKISTENNQDLGQDQEQDTLNNSQQS